MKDLDQLVLNLLESLRDRTPLKDDEKSLLRELTSREFLDGISLHELEFFLPKECIVKEWGGVSMDTAGFIFKVGDSLFKVSAYYDSWGGADYDYASIYQVEPKEIVTIEYVKKEN